MLLGSRARTAALDLDGLSRRLGREKSRRVHPQTHRAHGSAKVDWAARARHWVRSLGEPCSVGRQADARVRRAGRALSSSREQRARSARCVGIWSMPGPFRTLSSGLELRGRLGRQAVQGLPRARHCRQPADQRTQCPSHASPGAIPFFGALICELCEQTRTPGGRAEIPFYNV